MEALGNRNLKNTVRSHTAKRVTVIAAVVGAHLACGGIITGVANAGVGLTSFVTVSVNGVTGQWTPGGASATASATTAGPTPTPVSTPPASTPEQQVPAAPSAPETSPTTSSTVGTSPAHEPESPGEPAPTTHP